MKLSDLPELKYMKSDGATYEDDGMISFIPDVAAIADDRTLQHDGEVVTSIFHYADNETFCIVTRESRQLLRHDDEFGLQLVEEF